MFKQPSSPPQLDIYETAYKLNNNPKDARAFLASKFKIGISNLRMLTTTEEYGILKITVPLGYLIEFARNDIIDWLSLFIPANKRPDLIKKNWLDIEWCMCVASYLFELGAIDVIYWIFLHVPYFTWRDEVSRISIDTNREFYEKLLDTFYEKWDKNQYFNEKEFMFMTNTTAMTYALSYQNRSNKIILMKMCALIRKIAPFVNFVNPHLTSQTAHLKLILEYMGSPMYSPMNNTPLTKIRVCFVSDFLVMESSVLRDRMGIILGLEPKVFDVYYASTKTKNDIVSVAPKELLKQLDNKHNNVAASISNTISPHQKHMNRNINSNNNNNNNTNATNSHFITIPMTSLNDARQALSGFHILVFPEIGMRIYTTYLAYSRIAPIQINTWGHSETSGIDTIDYFITSKYFEVEDTDMSSSTLGMTSSIDEIGTHYSERPIIMNSLSTFYYNPAKLKYFDGDTTPLKSRKDLGFQDDEHIYNCMQTFFKLDIDFEWCIGEIIKRDPKARILLSNNIPFSKSHLDRIKTAIGGDINMPRIKFYAGISKKDYINFIKISDVMLDCFPFGGCNSSLEAIAFGVPVITFPSRFINGRFTLGFYKKMGFDIKKSCCIVASKEAYVENALKLTSESNSKLMKSIRDEILQRKDVLFEDKDSILEWNEMLLNVVKNLVSK